jgi:heterodisulfide reductase subunit A
LAQEEPRTGVIVCHCGTNIAGVLNIDELVEFAQGLPNVVHVEGVLYSCSSDGLQKLQNAIKDHNLTRMVVASCTPRTHEPLFRSACGEVGLNPFLYEMVNIREHCSWVHGDEPEAAMKRAKDQIRMGVAKAALLEPQEVIMADVTPVALIIGGGPAGMNAAVNLATRGFDVHLVEREDSLGGLLKKLNVVYPDGQKADDLLKAMTEKVNALPGLKVYLNSNLKEISGYIGNFKAVIESGGDEAELSLGVVVVATGADVLTPTGKYGYDGDKVITQLELEKRLAENTVNAKNIVMIQCVGALGDERVYCSRICCATAMKNARLLKEADPDSEVYILYRHMQAYGDELEELYRETREQGVVFVQYNLDKRPDVNDGFVEVYDESVQSVLQIPADMIVLATPLVGKPDSEEISKLLKVPRDANGFFLEAHVKLRPVDFATDGVYVCGTCHWPKSLPETLSQGAAAASRASIPMAKGRISIEPIISCVDEETCIGCGLCTTNCPYVAIEMVEGKAHVIEASCKGCGLCGASCPAQAISMRHFTDMQLGAVLTAAMEDVAAK